jgi:hypothetical protein
VAKKISKENLMTLRIFLILILSFLASQTFAGGDIFCGRLTFEETEKTLALEPEYQSESLPKILEISTLPTEAYMRLRVRLILLSGNSHLCLHGYFPFPDDPIHSDANKGHGPFIVTEMEIVD